MMLTGGCGARLYSLMTLHAGTLLHAVNGAVHQPGRLRRHCSDHTELHNVTNCDDERVTRPVVYYLLNNHVHRFSPFLIFSIFESQDVTDLTEGSNPHVSYSECSFADCKAWKVPNEPRVFRLSCYNFLSDICIMCDKLHVEIVW